MDIVSLDMLTQFKVAATLELLPCLPFMFVGMIKS